MTDIKTTNFCLVWIKTGREIGNYVQRPIRGLLQQEYLTEPLDRKPARQAVISLAGKY